MKPAFIDGIVCTAKAAALLLVALASMFPSALIAQQPVARSMLVLVSDRSSGGLVAAAHRYALADKSATQSVQIRTVSQINLLSDKALQQLASQADGILMAAVFGEPVERLLNLKYPQGQTRLAIDGDRRLLALHADPQQGHFESLSTEQTAALFNRLNDASEGSYQQQLRQQQQRWPQFSLWLQARAYWQNRGTDNRVSLLSLLAQPHNDWAKLQQAKLLRFLNAAGEQQSQTELTQTLQSQHRPTVFVLDHDSGDRPGDWQLHQAICRQFKQAHCVAVLSAWGEASVDAVQAIRQITGDNASQPFALISLQDFVVGGGDGREQVSELFAELNVPVFKGVRLTEWNAALYEISSQGLPADSVHYRIAMPELQGIGQAQVLALAAAGNVDQMTGAQITTTEPVISEVARLQKRVDNWFALKTKANADKKIAIVFYNHPPGRHNIGADNLNVPETLWQMLQSLQQSGYYLGPEEQLPGNAGELLDLLQQRAVNLPEDARALAAMADKVHTMSPADYEKWFQTLAASVQEEMLHGPLGFMHQRLEHFLLSAGQQYLLRLPHAEQQRIIRELQLSTQSTISDLRHALDGIRHNSRQRALNLLDQLQAAYLAVLERYQANSSALKQPSTQSQSSLTAAQQQWQQATQLQQTLIDMRIEGIRGWGKAPGKTMVWNNKLLIPGVQFGNVFLGPQPPRGWEINEELLHANMSFPPPHQYLAFYHYLANEFGADALVHVGRHSTYEFLPRRSVGLAATDYPSIITQDIPSIYPYIVDGVGEGIQAKRRGLAIMIDHLTPPLAITELYDGLLQLRQLIESAEAASDKTTQNKAIKALRRKIDALHLRDELIASMDEELKVRGVGFSEVDDEFLLHEVGHYLTNLQEQFMPMGLHVFGRDWEQQSITTMLTSMGEGDNIKPGNEAKVRAALQRSPQAEMTALLGALNGGFVAPGVGNDPIRTPESLPTGRNFHALDGSLLPTQLGADIGHQLAARARKENPLTLEQNKAAEKEAVILWASDAVRDEGSMIAFGMDMLGVKPVWNSRGIINSLELLPLTDARLARRDVLFTSSGLFRDLYASQLELLDQAVLLALATSRKTIEQQYPALTLLVKHALQPIQPLLTGQANNSAPQNETLEQNLVARNWVFEASQLLRASPDADASLLARQASLRIFSTAPGAYGAGVNRLAERSGAWQNRKQLGQAFIKRMGHAYGIEAGDFRSGSGAQDLFKTQLKGVGNTYLGRASNLYGLIDNNDAFDYLGGLNLAVETLTGTPPDSFVISHANNQNLQMDPLQTALLSELRGRFLNRQWLQPLMQEGYAGARTMGSEFIEYLWGWQVTSPEIIKDWVWEEVKSVYVDDALDIGLDEFLQDKHNVQVQTNMLAVMLVAIEKDFWQAGAATTEQLAQMFANNIIEHGIPGSGHTHANHPLYDFVKPLLNAAQAEQLEQTLAASRMEDNDQQEPATPARIQEIDANENRKPDPQQAKTDDAAAEPAADKSNSDNQQYLIAIVGFCLLLMLAGFVRARWQTKPT